MSEGLRVRAAHLVVDVTDLDRAAVFWSALLGLGVSGREAGYLDLGPLGVGGPVLSFQLVPETKAVKNRCTSTLPSTRAQAVWSPRATAHTRLARRR